MHGEIVGGKRKQGQPAKRLQHRITEYCSAFELDATCWVQTAQDAREWHRAVEEGTEKYMIVWTATRVNATNARHANALFAALPLEYPSCRSKAVEVS